MRSPNYSNVKHCVKRVHVVQSYFGLYFPAFGQNVKRYGVSLRISENAGK